MTDAEGNHRIINFSITALRGPDSRPQWLLSIGRDITPQRKAEELLEHLESDLTNVVQDMPAWVQLSRLDGTIEMVNEAACALSGYDRSEMVGQTWPYAWLPNGYDGENGDPFAELDRSGKILAFEAPCVTRQGESKTFGVTLSLVAGESGQPRRIMMVAHDMSERKRWEAELMQAEKIRAVSQLASGVAHDINNDLAVILGYSEYLLSKCGTLDDMERHALDAIQQQAQECAETVRRIQLFSRSVPKSKFAYCSVNDVVREVVTLTEPIWRSESKESWTGIQVETDLQWVPPVHAHLASLKEALTSLVNNAVAALPEGGTITLRTKNVGEDVMLEVSDTGVGIDSGHVGRIFDPFFTTKGPASSGLGLSIAYNLVTQMGGSFILGKRTRGGNDLHRTNAGSPGRPDHRH